MRITISFCTFLLLSVFLNSSLYHQVASSDEGLIGPNRETLEIIIGSGGISIGNPSPDHSTNCPPPPPKCPYRNSNGCFDSDLIAKSYTVIQRFKQRILPDANSIKYTQTWVGTDVCNYKGFKCATRPDKNKRAVSAVDFNGAKFSGHGGALPLNGFIDQMDDLVIFYANSNNFTGTVPSGVSKIKYLYELDLSNNKLAGDFPTDVLGASNLTFLDLRFNSIKGALPPGVFKLDLDVLFVNNNNFQQRLPDNLGDTSVLYLTFANNKFTGPIPTSIGRAPNLLEVLFINNQLTGCVPYEIGNLTKARVFDVSSNHLTGPIPFSFGCLKNMELLNLGNNKFYGPVPESICQLPKVETLTLANNYFTLVGPACRNLIAKKKLNIRNNCIFDLPNQKSKAECDAFFSKPLEHVCARKEMFNWVPCNKRATERRDQETTTASSTITSSKIYRTFIPHRL